MKIVSQECSAGYAQKTDPQKRDFIRFQAEQPQKRCKGQTAGKADQHRNPLVVQIIDKIHILYPIPRFVCIRSSIPSVRSFSRIRMMLTLSVLSSI